MRSIILTKKIFNFLNTNSEYAVLRNYEGLPEINLSRDIDIIIHKKTLLKNLPKIIEIISATGFKITTYYKSDKIVTLVCCDVKDGMTDIIQFDFFFNTSIYGIVMLNAAELLKNRVNNGRIFHVSKEYEFLDKYLQFKLLGEEYPKKYSKLLSVMEDSTILKDILKNNFNLTSIEEFETRSRANLLSFFLFNKKSNLLNIFVFIYFYIINFLFYQGFSIGFSGPDGSGKTTVIEKVTFELNKVYSNIDLFHFRPSILKNLGEVAIKAKAIKEVDRNYQNPHRGSKTNKFNSFLRLCYYSLDYMYGYFALIRPRLTKRQIVIFDRYFTDIITDSKRSRIYLDFKFLYFFKLLFIPKLDHNILLTASPKAILQRKQELSYKEIIDINKKLKYLSKKNYDFILNDQEVDHAAQSILEKICNTQHKKNILRIKN